MRADKKKPFTDKEYQQLISERLCAHISMLEMVQQNLRDAGLKKSDRLILSASDVKGNLENLNKQINKKHSSKDSKLISALNDAKKRQKQFLVSTSMYKKITSRKVLKSFNQYLDSLSKLKR